MSLFNRANPGRGPLSGGNNPTNKPVCQYYLQGRCRFGDACKNYHPPRDQSSTSTSNTSNDRNLPYHLSRDAIKADFTFGDDRPTWPLSAYGPGRDAPRQLLEGPIEQSPEELRVQCYLAKAAGNPQQYEQSEQSAVSEANQRAQQILTDLDGAIKYVIDGKDVHPNREDMCLKATTTFNWTERPSPNQSSSQQSGSGSTFGQSSSAFGGGSTATFGKPSAFGQPSTGAPAFGTQSGGTSAFGKPSAIGSGASAFGQASGGGPSAFGQPSAMRSGQSPFGAQHAPSSSPFGPSASNTGGSAFGQPSQPGGTSAFAKPSTAGGGSAFGKPSPFGAAASSGTPAFGQSTFGSQPATGSPAFGQASQPSQQQSAFGQASQPVQQQSAFGQPSQPGQQQSAFGKPSQAGQQQSAFGQASQAGQQSAFGQPSQTGQQSAFGKPSPFGASNGGTTSTFGQPTSGSPSAFGEVADNAAFGRPSTTGQQPSAFGATSSEAQNTAFGASSGANASTGSFGTQPTTSTSTARPGQPLTSLKGQRLIYENRQAFYNNPQTGKKERVWFPEGPPGPNPDTEASPQTYEALGAVLKQVYDFVRENGTFKDGVVPEVPPKRDWVNWDL